MKLLKYQKSLRSINRCALDPPTLKFMSPALPFLLRGTGVEKLDFNDVTAYSQILNFSHQSRHSYSTTMIIRLYVACFHQVRLCCDDKSYRK